MRSTLLQYYPRFLAVNGPAWCLMLSAAIALKFLASSIEQLDATSKQLQHARQQHALVLSLAEQIEHAKVNLPGPGRKATLNVDAGLELLTHLMESASIPVTRVRKEKAGKLRVSVDQVKYSNLVDVLITLRQQHSISVDRASVHALEEPATVSCELQFKFNDKPAPKPGQFNI